MDKENSLECDVRVGDDRIINTANGRIIHCFGYYSESQQLMRKLMFNQADTPRFPTTPDEFPDNSKDA